MHHSMLQADTVKHDFVASEALDESVMLPYTELASLECFTLWSAEH